jgi:circadian clock protein KaiC
MTGRADASLACRHLRRRVGLPVARNGERTGARRVLIDSLTDLQLASSDSIRFREYMYSLVQRLARQGVSLFMTSELPDLFDTAHLSEYGVSHLADNVVLLQYIREQSSVRRALTVLKTRASRHEPEIREYTITPEGIVLGTSFAPAPSACTPR